LGACSKSFEILFKRPRHRAAKTRYEFPPSYMDCHLITLAQQVKRWASLRRM
jgi:hypothetical protein